MSHTLSKTTDQVFRALSDPSRRRILDLLKADSGLTVSELAVQFTFSRFAVMKHLRVLEECELVVARRDGKTKRLFLNAVPIQTIYDRWISQYSALWASGLTAMKYELEGEEEMSQTATKLKHVYVTYIRTTPEKLWDALTNPEMTQKYFHGTRVKGDFSVGSTVDYIMTDDSGDSRVALTGEVTESVPGKKLVHTFRFPSNDDKPSRVTYEIEATGAVCKLTLLHDEFEGETQTYTSVQNGWPPIFSGLKTLLETGEALPIGA